MPRRHYCEDRQASICNFTVELPEFAILPPFMFVESFLNILQGHGLSMMI
jgi:hypothetical protein